MYFNKKCIIKINQTHKNRKHTQSRRRLIGDGAGGGGGGGGG